MVRTRTKRKGRTRLVLTSFLLPRGLLVELRVAAREHDLSLGQLLRRASQEWLAKAKHETLPDLDAGRNADWIRRRRSAKRGSR